MAETEKYDIGMGKLRVYKNLRGSSILDLRQ